MVDDKLGAGQDESSVLAKAEQISAEAQRWSTFYTAGVGTVMTFISGVIAYTGWWGSIISDGVITVTPTHAWTAYVVISNVVIGVVTTFASIYFHNKAINKYYAIWQAGNSLLCELHNVVCHTDKMQVSVRVINLSPFPWRIRSMHFVDLGFIVTQEGKSWYENPSLMGGPMQGVGAFEIKEYLFAVNAKDLKPGHFTVNIPESSCVLIDVGSKSHLDHRVEINCRRGITALKETP